jgi:uncharacterized protein (DUF1684 family)
VNERLALLDYRRRVVEMYARARDGGAEPAAACRDFRRARDELFRTHPQSALAPDQRAAFGGLKYFAYDPSLRFTLDIDTTVDRSVIEVHLRDDGLLRLHRFGRVHFVVAGRRLSLSLFWISGYGGGVFLPFKDVTAAQTTYPGGRYVLDTIKGADLGSEGTRLIVDFNYAYNPSCAYHARWDCPLAPEENHLPVAIRAGEQRFL